MPTPDRAGAPSIHPTVIAGAAILVAARAGVGLAQTPLWTDEAISLGALDQLGTTIRGTGGTMAAYYVVLDGWTRVVGTSPVALRSLSLLMAIATIVLLAPLVRRLLPAPTSHIALIVTAALPGMALAGQEARSYAMTILLATAMWGCLARAVDHGAGLDDRLTATARRWLNALIPLAVLGVLAHGLFTLQVIALAISALVLPRRRAVLVALAPVMGAASMTAGALIILGARDVADWIPPLSQTLVVQALEVTLAPHRVVLTFLLGMAVVGAVLLLRRPTPDAAGLWRAVAPVTWAAIPFGSLCLISIGRPYLLGRYLLASTPALAMLISTTIVASWRLLVGVLASIRRADPGQRRDAAPASVVHRRLATFLVGGTMIVALGAGAPAKVGTVERWADAATYVAQRAQPDDGILFTPSLGAIAFSVRTPFAAAWREIDRTVDPVPLAGGPPLDAVLRFYPADGDETGRDRLTGRTRIWIVHKTRADTGDGALTALVHGPELGDHFAVASHADFTGGVQVLLLVRESALPA